MAKKMKQITDSIHGTIYLSELEAELTSTPYFYRLHDIYQSSTVYMTFPTNRTKRYEHSLGTMELASSMIFSSLSNSENETKIAFFKALKKYFEEILSLTFLQAESITAPYFTKCQDDLNKIFNTVDLNVDFDSLIENIVKNDLCKSIQDGCFHDSALDNFQFYPMTVYTVGIGNDAQNFFLYRCVLQAIRIVALFHDVGHPPYSHIIESELNSLYREISDKTKSEKEDWNKTRVAEFKRIMKPYATDNNEESYKCQTIYSHSNSVDSQLHERIGLSLLQSAMNNIIPEMIARIANSDEKREAKITKALYYILIMEFTLAILVEKDCFFQSLHKIVDGVIDADRLDYIMRDSLNSGVDWGNIPYKRIINSSKLFWLRKDKNEKELHEDYRPFVIAYPMKVADDIIDLMVVRYKIFARINFHHRCIKTTVALQSAVRELAKDYLTSKDKTEYIEGINTLWTALNLAMGERSIRIIQWNDSWLITVLHHALIELITKENSKSTRKVIDPTRRALKENLEEILLNKKRYYSLIKRGLDSKKFVNEVFDYIGLSKEILDTLEERERKKYYSYESEDTEDSGEALFSSGIDAFEALKRIRRLQELRITGDMEILDDMLPPMGVGKNSLFDLLDNALKNKKIQNRIEDYSIIMNSSRRKTGLPRHRNIFEEIYLYVGSEISTLDEDKVLRPQIETIEKNSPWIFIYYVPPKKVASIDDLELELFQAMVEVVGDNLKERFEELFHGII